MAIAFERAADNTVVGVTWTLGDDKLRASRVRSVASDS
jgi:hypothetical protein